MSQANTPAQQANRPTLRQTPKAPAETRIDGAHPATTEACSATAVAETVTGEVVAEQLRTQATQLASSLRTRQRELDHRESQLNARFAQLERDARTARLWLSERERELARRQEELDERNQEVQGRLQRLATAEAAQRRSAGIDERVARRREELDAQARRLADRAASLENARRQWESHRQRAEDALRHERQRLDFRLEASQQLARQLLAGLQRRRRALEAQEARLQGPSAQTGPDLLAREQALRPTAEALEARQGGLHQAESQLADARAQTQQLQRQLLEARRQVDEEASSQREKLAAEQRRAAAELERKRQAVERRSRHVDERRVALEQLRDELGRMHRETLEIRLATAELWVEVSEAAPPATLTRSLGRIRSKLAKQYRQGDAELQRRKQELQGLRDQILGQCEQLSRRKRDFEKWADARQQDIEQQAVRLIAREAELKQRENELADQTHRWQIERLECQQEIRHLQTRLAELEASSIPVH